MIAIYTIFLPMLVFYIFGIPFFLYRKLEAQRFKLHTKKVKLKFSFLYKGYRHELYYWEFTVMARKIALVVLEVLYAGNVQVQALMVIGMLTVIGECLSLTNLAFFLIAVRNVINNRYCHSRDHALRPPSPQHPRARLSCLCLHDIFLRTVFLSRSCRVHVVRSHRFFLFILLLSPSNF